MLKRRILSPVSVLAIVLSMAATWLTWRYHGYPTVGIDDANVFFAYAENLIGGYGFVYNPGGERVEGFTSLLWLLSTAAIFRTGFGEGTILIMSVVLVGCVR